MELKIYPLLSTCSRRSMKRTKKTYRGYYGYFPRHQLLARLCKTLNMSEGQVLDQIQREREFLLSLKKLKGV